MGVPECILLIVLSMAAGAYLVCLALGKKVIEFINELVRRR